MGVSIGGKNVTASITNTTFTTVEDFDQNSCLCDKLYNICDLNCCCDTQCSAEVVSTWNSQGLCDD
jgi:Protein of unknown function (DUF1619)